MRGSLVSSSLFGAAIFAVASMASPALADKEPPRAPAPTTPSAQVATSAGATAKEERAKAALKLHDEAWVLYEEGRYRAAIERLEAAVRVDPEGAELVYNLGLLHEKLANLKAAASYYRQYLTMETDPKARARVAATLRRVEGAEREQTVNAEPPPPAPLVVAAPAPPPPAPPPPDHRAAAIAATSVAAGAFLTGIGCGIAALVKNPGSGAQTTASVSVTTLQSEAQSAHDAAIAADVAFIVGAASAVTAAVLFATSGARPDARAKSRTTRVVGSIVPAPTGPFGVVRVVF